jgi:pre-mRNA cleavage complex 2 protein Pcf11
VSKAQPSQVSTRTPVTTAATPATVASVPVPTPLPGDLTEMEMRENLLRKQKELIELQQKKIEIEYLQTKARLQQQQVT